MRSRRCTCRGPVAHTTAAELLANCRTGTGGTVSTSCCCCCCNNCSSPAAAPRLLRRGCCWMLCTQPSARRQAKTPGIACIAHVCGLHVCDDALAELAVVGPEVQEVHGQLQGRLVQREDVCNSSSSSGSKSRTHSMKTECQPDPASTSLGPSWVRNSPLVTRTCQLHIQQLASCTALPARQCMQSMRHN